MSEATVPSSFEMLKRVAHVPPSGGTRTQGLQNSAWLIIPALLFVLFFFVFPLGRMFLLSFIDPHLTLRHYAEFVRMPVYFRIMLNTFILALNVSLICLVLGYPVAYTINSMSPRTRRLFLIPVMLPYLMSLMVRTFAWMVVLGREGIVNQFLGTFDLGPFKLMNNSLGVYVGMIHYLLPLMILPLLNTMRTIDMRLVRAAEGLGATSFQVFVRVFVPLSLPGVAAGMCLVFIIALGFFITPALLGGLGNMTVSMLIENQVGIVLNWGFASALAVLLLFMTIVTLVAVTLLVRRVNHFWAIRGFRLIGGDS